MSCKCCCYRGDEAILGSFSQGRLFEMIRVSLQARYIVINDKFYKIKKNDKKIIKKRRNGPPGAYILFPLCFLRY